MNTPQRLNEQKKSVYVVHCNLGEVLNDLSRKSFHNVTGQSLSMSSINDA